MAPDQEVDATMALATTTAYASTTEPAQSTVDEALVLLCSSPCSPEAEGELLTMLAKILGNIVDHPAESKFRKLNLGSVRLQKAVLCYKGAREFLAAVGFVNAGDNFLEMPSGTSAPVAVAHSAVLSRRQRLEQAPAKPPTPTSAASGVRKAPEPMAAVTGSDPCISRASKRPKIDSSDNEIPAEVLAALMASGEDLSAFDLPGMNRKAGVSAASSSTSGAAAASRGAPAGIKPPPAASSSEDETAVGIMKRNQTPAGVFRLLTWNIDGLDQDHDDLIERLVNGVISVIPDFAPDAVLLQEVVQPTLLTIKRFLSPLYEIFAPNPPLMPYFSAIMVRKSPRIKLRKHKDGNILQRVPFPGTQMGRELLFVEIMIDGIECYVSTAHLESQKTSENQRKVQLDRCLKHVSQKSLSNDMSFFGGDLNLRDPEASTVLGKLDFPDCLIRDAWELDGCNQDKRFTWDLQRNNNIVTPGMQPRCRFDRLYVAPKRTSTSDGNAIALTAEEQQHVAEFRQMKGIKLGGKKALTKAQVTEQTDFLFKKKVKCKRFTLMGCKRLEHGRFPSDHFGILSEWELVKDGQTGGSS